MLFYRGVKKIFSTISLSKRLTSTILGIETSCDDTGAAVVTTSGKILGQSIASQNSTTIKLGGVLPKIAAQLHADNIERVVSESMDSAGVSWKDLDAIAVTVKPGMAFSLKVGVDYSKKMALQHNLAVIPIHHMEAHALTALLTHSSLKFPFLVVLVSGGHSLLALAQNIEDFLLLGTSLDISPGECLDKIARRLRVSWLDDGIYNACSGGHAIELLALTSSELVSTSHGLPTPRSGKRDCDFSFSGIQVAADRLISRLESSSSSCGPSGVLAREEIATVCASAQLAVTRLLCRRLQRAIEFCALNSLLTLPPLPGSSWHPEKSDLVDDDDADKPAVVVSGGVGSNLFIRSALTRVAQHYGMQLVAPPPTLCTDNGVMIAWNGALLHNAGLRVLSDPNILDYTPKVPFGKDIRDKVRDADIKIKPLRITSKLN